MVFGILFVCMVLLSKGSASPTQSNNSSLSLILADQCVTREEVKIEIQAQTDQIQEMQNQMRNEIQSIASMVRQLLENGGGPQNPEEQLPPSAAVGTPQNPAQSCSDIQGQPSNYYWLQNSFKTSSPTRQYCDMTRRCCGSTGGWMQVANLDMTNSSQNCPSGFRGITFPRRMCGRHNIGCVSATFPVHGVEYSRVCGRVTGYQYGSPNAFDPYIGGALTIDDTYIDGVSITHGQSPRKHVWTFAADKDEISSNSRCSCIRQSFSGPIPPFVGNDYFCDTGSRVTYTERYYTEDPLWNGQGCGSVSTCCSFNNPPWFCKRLTQPTRDDIEVRICADQAVSNEDVGIETIELFVQ